MAWLLTRVLYIPQGGGSPVGWRGIGFQQGEGHTLVTVETQKSLFEHSNRLNLGFQVIEPLNETLKCKIYFRFGTGTVFIPYKLRYFKDYTLN
jgi:hypothetical protein